jgi:hypothetical protein
MVPGVYRDDRSGHEAARADDELARIDDEVTAIDAELAANARADRAEDARDDAVHSRTRILEIAVGLGLLAALMIWGC